ncbi:pentapeptide repeat-containing protein [Planomonospora sp. ID67723]|nr:pentapeptide repeat-containing protein [Planomonospora sp. ID67723]MBG0828267.1 pentapeptide repeat-containing protein [Planomonospora sp. ID67723]
MPSRTRGVPPPQVREPVAPRLPASLTAAVLPDRDLEDDGIYRALDFKGVDLSFRRTEAADFEGCRFSDTRLSGTELHRAGFIDGELERCDLSNMVARTSTLHRVRISASRLTGMTWSGCALRDVVFDGCRADLTRFRFSTFKNAVFRDCTMPEADFQNADLRGVRFERCDLTGAQFSNARMEGARFADCTLLKINGVTGFRGAVIGSRDAQGLVYSLAGAMGIVIGD